MASLSFLLLSDNSCCCLPAILAPGDVKEVWPPIHTTKHCPQIISSRLCPPLSLSLFVADLAGAWESLALATARTEKRSHALMLGKCEDEPERSQRHTHQSTAPQMNVMNDTGILGFWVCYTTARSSGSYHVVYRLTHYEDGSALNRSYAVLNGLTGLRPTLISLAAVAFVRAGAV